ncbi:MAG TPA: hypothetical protein VFU53_08660 [Burkholderiales bacterium]|nr:hypothetical protein [Burkholderiales bacterium]
MEVGLVCSLIVTLLSAPRAHAGRDAAQIVEQQRIVAAVKAARAQLSQDTQHGRTQLTWDARGQAHRLR